VKQKLIKAFQATKYEADLDLPENVWQAVVLRDRCIARAKLWTFSVIGFISLVGLIPVLKALLSDFTQSGFSEYLSLAFSSSGLIITYWKDFLLLLAESLPVLSIISSLTLVFIFFLSIKYAMKQIIKSPLTLSF
jgi:hypothetical protein